jgi:YD repeat-containing protein
VPQPGVFSTLVKNTDATFTLTKKNQTKYVFSVAGKLTTIQDKNGNTIFLIYDGSGNLIRVTDTVGRALNLSYDATNTSLKSSIRAAVRFRFSTTRTTTLFRRLTLRAALRTLPMTRTIGSSRLPYRTGKPCSRMHTMHQAGQSLRRTAAVSRLRLRTARLIPETRPSPMPAETILSTATIPRCAL